MGSCRLSNSLLLARGVCDVKVLGVVWQRAGLTGLGAYLVSTLAFAEPGGPAPAAQTREWQPSDNDTLEPHHFRSLVEMTGGLGLGALAYWLMQNRNVADWDNPTPEERFDGQAWRVDNNSLAVNFIAHPLAGGLAYSMARANHHDVFTSFGYASLTSFLWEFVLEFKEKVSVNDLIVTSPTGVPIGEFFYKLGLYLDTAARPGLGTQAARWTLGTGVSLDRALDGRPPPVVDERDELGFTSIIWHEFEAGAGLDFVQSPGVSDYTRPRIGMLGRLVTLPGYLAPKAFRRGFYQAEISEFAWAVEASTYGAGLALHADTVVAGYHFQDLRGTVGVPHGFAATFGVSLGYDYLRSHANHFSEFDSAAQAPPPDLSYHVPVLAEQYGALQLPGPAVDYRVYLPGVRLVLTARAAPSYAGFGAPAFYEWTGENLEERSKHILHRQGYFYGWGGMGSLGGSLAIGPLVLGGRTMYASYVSQDGLDRHIERVTVDVRARGNLLSYGGSIGVRPWELPFTLSADFGVRRWYSNVADFESRGRIVSRGIGGKVDF